MRFVLIWTCLCTLVSALAMEVAAAAENAGRELATSYCGACHRVSAEQAPTSKVTVDKGSGIQEFEAPSFRQIAARAGRDAEYLRAFIQAPHYPMREQLFIPEELDQIVSYILSLKADGGEW